jgi:four helix bundle protein
MATIERFEQIEAWKLARELSKEIYWITNNTDLVKDFGLKNQMRDSSGSIMDNIAEGFERGGNKEFVQFLGVSKGSAAELKSQLYSTLDQNDIDKNKFQELYDYVENICKLIMGLIKYLRSSDYKGLKFK